MCDTVPVINRSIKELAEFLKTNSVILSGATLEAIYAHWDGKGPVAIVMTEKQEKSIWEDIWGI